MVEQAVRDSIINAGHGFEDLQTAVLKAEALVNDKTDNITVKFAHIVYNKTVDLYFILYVINGRNEDVTHECIKPEEYKVATVYKKEN